MTTEQAFSRLTDRQRTLIRLRDHEKLTWAKVGEALGVGGQYAAQLHKAAVKELARLEAEPDEQTPPQARSAPVYSTPEEKVIHFTDNSFLSDGGSFKASEPAKPRTVISRGEPADTNTKVAVVTGQRRVHWAVGKPVTPPMAVPERKAPWTSVTLRA